MNSFKCRDKREKVYRLIFDGGTSGNYCLEICKSCYQSQSKKFLISVELRGITGSRFTVSDIEINGGVRS